MFDLKVINIPTSTPPPKLQKCDRFEIMRKIGPERYPELWKANLPTQLNLVLASKARLFTSQWANRAVDAKPHTLRGSLPKTGWACKKKTPQRWFGSSLN